AIDGRFEIINGVADPKMKKVVKGEPDWGDPPKGTRAQLIGDIAGILDEAITNIDDVSRRDEKSPLISRSLRRLTTVATGYANQLTAMSKQTKDNDELYAIEQALETPTNTTKPGTKFLHLPAPAKRSNPNQS